MADMYRCPCCGESVITLAQKAWVCYCGRSATCRTCGGRVGIPTAVRWLTNSPLILYVLVLYLYFRSLPDEQLRSRESFWLLIVGVLVVPTIYGLLTAALRVWLVPLVRR